MHHETTVVGAVIDEWPRGAAGCDHATVTSYLPAGWTTEQIRTLSQDRSATPLSPDRLVVVGGPDQNEYGTLQPEAVLRFHDLCHVLDDGEWYMGQLGTDGSVVCWASYGPDLAEAIRNL